MSDARGYILLTGGLGFIGSHIAVELLQHQYSVIIIDNLANSQIHKLASIRHLCNLDSNNPRCRFFEMDIRNSTALNLLFNNHKIDHVIHLAGLKAVAESLSLPLTYYNCNLVGTLTLLEVMKSHSCHNLIFSSSATVYGDASYPVDETSQTGQGITNPYGWTKWMIEQMLMDLCRADPQWKVVILRYFNPVGQHPSGLIPEDPRGLPNNLFPYLLRVARGQHTQLSVFGSDYPTPDGTAVRDFIHVQDLASGHLSAIEANLPKGIHVYNLGTGQGTSVLELITTFEQVNGVKLNYKLCDRRAGDLPSTYALVSKAKNELGWEAEKTIADICRDGYVRNYGI